MAALQPDLFIEVDERLLIKDNPALKVIADALPQRPIIKAYQIAEVLPVSTNTIYNWIRQMKFEYIDLTTGDERSRYGIYRKSFLEFLASRVNKIR